MIRERACDRLLGSLYYTTNQVPFLTLARIFLVLAYTYKSLFFATNYSELEDPVFICMI